MDEQMLAGMIAKATVPFHKTWDFWVDTLLAVLGLIFSVMAFVEAKAARKAASEAGSIVKAQTITIELTEIAQKLDKLDSPLQFVTARDLLNEASRKLRRLIAPIQAEADLVEPCRNLRHALDSAKETLAQLSPAEDADQDPSGAVVYFKMQGQFATISGIVAEVMGLLEKRTIDRGQNHV